VQVGHVSGLPFVEGSNTGQAVCVGGTYVTYRHLARAGFLAECGLTPSGRDPSGGLIPSGRDTSASADIAITAISIPAVTHLSRELKSTLCLRHFASSLAARYLEENSPIFDSFCAPPPLPVSPGSPEFDPMIDQNRCSVLKKSG